MSRADKSGGGGGRTHWKVVKLYMLADQWERDAMVLDKWGADPTALRQCAAELREAVDLGWLASLPSLGEDEEG